MDNGPNNLRQFGRFRLDTEKRVLWFEGAPVSLPPKEIDVLSVLTEQPGEVISKQELMDRIWADTFVEESNLFRHIYRLRKTFDELGAGENVIQTVPRRGYRFSLEVAGANGHDLVIESHSLTRTVIEELDSTDEDQVLLPPARAFPKWSTVLTVSAGVLVLVGAFVVSSSLFGTASNARKINSVAVLPFNSIGESASDNEAGIGFADILITRLGGLKRVAVRPLSSVSTYQTGNADPIEFGRRLGVDAVLDGSIYRSAGKVRVTVRLIAVDGVSLWSGSFERQLSDELYLQDEVAMRVADAVAPQLDPQEKRAVAKRYTDNRDAYEAYLRGRFFFDKRDPSVYQSAIDEFRHAIALDPNYALAYSGLADVYAMQANNAGDSRLRDEMYANAKEALLAALSIDDELAEAHTSLAWVKRIHEWDWEGSEREFKRAIELNPNYYNARMWYSFLLLTLGRKDEALAEIEKARELAPLTPSVIANYHTVRYFRQDNDVLLDIAEQEKKMAVRDYRVARTYSQTFLRLKQYERVIDIVNDFQIRNGEGRYDTLDSDLASAYALIGNKERADAIIERLRSKVPKNSEAGFRLALVLADMGRDDEAISYLQRCADVRDDRVMWILVEPRFDRLRDNPRFQAIVKRMNLPG